MLISYIDVIYKERERESDTHIISFLWALSDHSSHGSGQGMLETSSITASLLGSSDTENEPALESPTSAISVSTRLQPKQKRVRQERQIILWHSRFCVPCSLSVSLVMAIRQVGHCCVPVSRIHRRNSRSLESCLVASYSSHV